MFVGVYQFSPFVRNDYGLLIYSIVTAHHGATHRFYMTIVFVFDNLHQFYALMANFTDFCFYHYFIFQPYLFHKIHIHVHHYQCRTILFRKTEFHGIKVLYFAIIKIGDLHGIVDVPKGIYVTEAYLYVYLMIEFYISQILDVFYFHSAIFGVKMFYLAKVLNNTVECCLFCLFCCSFIPVSVRCQRKTMSFIIPFPILFSSSSSSCCLLLCRQSRAADELSLAYIMLLYTFNSIVCLPAGPVIWGQTFRASCSPICWPSLVFCR